MNNAKELPPVGLEEIRRTAAEPAYAQLAGIIRRQIHSGTFRPGDRLPSEAQLCQRYGVSPMTVRRSINLLIDQGVVSTERGRGTFVKPLDLGAATFDLHGLQELFDGGTDTNVKLLGARIVSADERIAWKLDLDVGSNVIHIRRLVSKNRKPLLYHRAYLAYVPDRPIVEAEMGVTSLQGLFDNANRTLLRRGELTIEAGLMTEEEARVLQTPLPAAALYLEHLFYDFDRPISWGWFVVHSDHLRFTSKMGIEVSSQAEELSPRPYQERDNG